MDEERGFTALPADGSHLDHNVASSAVEPAALPGEPWHRLDQQETVAELAQQIGVRPGLPVICSDVDDEAALAVSQEVLNEHVFAMLRVAAPIGALSKVHLLV